MSAVRTGLAALVIGCGSGEAPRGPAGSAPVGEPRPADSLALRTPSGVELWYTLARPGRATDGTSCVDRALEVRRGERRIPVPLLYTGTAPELVNDSTVRARLSNQCRPGPSYLVDLRTGRPTPER